MAQPSEVRILPPPRSLPRTVLATLLAGVVLVLLVPVAISAAPNGTRIVAVYRASACGGGVCSPGGPTIESGAVVTGRIQIHVESQSAIGLSVMRLEGRGPADGSWYCLDRWSPGGERSYAAWTNWSTANWSYPAPSSGCLESEPHRHGEASVNGPHSLRVVARESGTGATQISPEFSVDLANPPAAPTWRGSPATAPNGDGVRVTLRWYRNTEPDVTQYRITRRDQRGITTTTTVGAANPQAAGCLAEHEATFTCFDDGAPAGTNTYRVTALRPGTGGTARCGGVACVASPQAPAKTVSIAAAPAEPAPMHTATPTAVASPTPTTTASPTRAAPTVAPTISSVRPTLGGPLAAPPSSDGAGLGFARSLVLAGALLLLTGVWIAIWLKRHQHWG